MSGAHQPKRKRSKPETFEPPYAAHTSVFPDDWPDYAMALLGVQAPEPAAGGALEAQLIELLDGASGPLHYERVTETDAAGYQNRMFIAYWRDEAGYRAWSRLDAVAALFGQPLSGAAGVWRETAIAPVGNVDPSGFRHRHEWGLGRHVTQEWERYHGYYGSMRDRMPNGHEASIAGMQEALAERPPGDTRGRCLRIVAPHNCCFIRGVFGWRQASAAEQRVFLDEMMPVYETGAYFLRDNAVETACISARVATELPMELDTGIDAETIAWFVSLEALERWTHSHPTHAAIFGKAIEIAHRFDYKLQLNLGHEVVVVPAGGATMDYNNCHPATGFLRFFEPEIRA